MKLKIIIFLIALVISMSGLYRHQLKKAKRLDSNQTVLLSDIDRYKNKDSLNVISIGKLVETKKEFKKFNEDLVDEVESLNVKLKRVQSVQKTKTITKVEFKTIIKDSLIIVDNVIRDTLKCMEYKNAYVDFSGCFINDTLNASIHIPDTLIQVVHRVPKKFLFFKFGTKAIKQEIYSKNPYTNIVYSDYIELK